MRISIIFLLLISFIFCQAQERTNNKTNREVILNSGDSIIMAHILHSDKRISTNPRKTYFWYLRGKINRNIGDYSGKLLNGSYQVFLEDRMILSGTFNNGMRNGKWISWNNDGSVDKVTMYKNGIPKDPRTKTGNNNKQRISPVETPEKPKKHLKIFRSSKRSTEKVSKKLESPNPEN